ncbi:hypothetical protein ATJ97_2511 [Georgenia soli]|uniref:Uncharacterized protein n=1 Tax=Georgenia soli TaxID=638953 RepID=A0A2A9EN81_9MICO|nr:hypothetical protein [Georgenia soli]PFG39991.1 hypothetical protein ATJ97_2511 [Georgenia soli]
MTGTRHSTARTWRRRAGAVAAAVAAMGIASATSASAHHCYKVDWNDSAREQLAKNRTAWMPLSDLGAMIIGAPVEQGGYGRPDCAGSADVAVAAWMEQAGVSQEPLIHSKATVGSGAAYQGKAPKGFAYLSEDDFGVLVMAIDADLAQTCDGF